MRVALIFGGRSVEHDVSVVSAGSVAGALTQGGHEVVPMAIDRTGSWATPEDARRVLAEAADRTDRVSSFKGSCRLDTRLLEEQFDVAFSALHGPYGEDGTIQGLFEMLDLAYVGCDVTASALCMDKLQSKRVLVQSGYRTAPWVSVSRHRWQSERETVESEILGLGLPVFVKPARLGSSVGISKVKDRRDLGPAVASALDLGPSVVVEQGLNAREIEVAVLGNEAPNASLPGEVIPGHDFYDYDDKYVDSNCHLLAPAPVDEAMTERIRSLAVEVFQLLGCEGMARVDLFLQRDTQQLWVNEVNTIPGFTSISMYPRLWALTGIAYPDLVDELLRLAVARHQR